MSTEARMHKIGPDFGGAPTSARRYHFLMPAWGSEYLERMLQTGLPSQLAPGNLPSMPQGSCIYEIFTRSADLPQLEAAASFQRLKQTMSVVVTTIDDLDLSHSHVAMTACYERGIRRSRGIDTAFVFLTPDSIWSDGAFLAMHRRQLSGKRAVLLAGLRMREEGAVEQIRRRHFDSERQALSIAPRALVAHCLDNLHPLSAAHLCEHGGNYSLGHYYFRAGEHGLLARCVHIHPLMVRPSVPDQEMETTLDHEYVRRSCPEFGDIHVVEDSDELCCVEFSRASLHGCMIKKELIHEHEVAAFLREWTNAFHRDFLSRSRIRFHAEDIDPQTWKPVEDRSDELIRSMLDSLYGSEVWDGLAEMRHVKRRYMALKSPNPWKRGFHKTKRFIRRTLGKAYRGAARLLPITHTARRIQAELDALNSRHVALVDRVACLEAALARATAHRPKLFDSDGLLADDAATRAAESPFELQKEIA